MAGRATRPNATDLEISVLGPGYGECIVVHLTDGRWMVVDSCLDGRTKTPAAVAYLNELGVDRSAVEVIVATHWHDDHVRGMGELVQQCGAARFCMSSAFGSDEFFELVHLYSDGASMISSSGVDEFASVMKTLKGERARGFERPPREAASARTLAESPGAPSWRVLALSPSDSATAASRASFGSLLPQPRRPKRRIGSPTANAASVALLVTSGAERVLLGGDLEVTRRADDGWAAVVDEHGDAIRGAKVFKVAHHGSFGAHHEATWQLLAVDTHCVLTPFSRPPGLPTQEDASRICGRSENAWISADPRAVGEFQHPSSAVKKTVREVARSVRVVNRSWGHVRLRKDLTAPDGEWRVELFGDARPLRALMPA